MAQACAYLCCHRLDEIWWLRWILTKWCIKTAVCVTISCFGCLLSLQNNLWTCQVNADRSRRCLCDYQRIRGFLKWYALYKSTFYLLTYLLTSFTTLACRLHSADDPQIGNLQLVVTASYIHLRYHIFHPLLQRSPNAPRSSADWKHVIVCCFCEASRMGTLVWRWVTVRVKKIHLPLLLASGRGSGHVSLPVEVCVVPGHAAYTSTKLERYKYTFQDITTACLRGNLYVVWLWHGHDHTPVYFGKQIHT